MEIDQAGKQGGLRIIYASPRQDGKLTTALYIPHAFMAPMHGTHPAAGLPSERRAQCLSSLKAESTAFVSTASGRCSMMT